MVAPEAPDNESLRIELQEALVTYRHWVAQLIQAVGFFVAADVVLASYGFSQRIAIVLLVASALPMLILVQYMVIGSIASPLINLVLRIERRLRIQKDSLGATFARTQQGKMIPALDSPIEGLNDEEVRHLNLKWELRWSAMPIILYAATAVQIVLFVLSLTVFHYRCM
jgi:hypothetical protein